MGRGALHTMPSLLTAHAPATRYITITDETVATLHGRRLVDGMNGAGLDAVLITFPAGEAHKTLSQVSLLLESLGDMGVGRDACIVALGGGVTGDLAGFAAATFARGVALVHVPTTLLAMVDAALGGKSAVDLRAGKNLAGAFHQPRLIVVDPAVLDTLSWPILAGGLAEAVKHGAVADASYFDWIDASVPALVDRAVDALDRLVAGSVRIKTAIVARDPHEAGERAALNFGHTIAHSIERVTGYACPHGDAVAIGMVAEARIGERLGITTAGTADRLATVLARLDLPTAPPAIDVEAALAATRVDKKARGGEPRYALLRDIGSIARSPGGGWTHPVPDDVVHTVLR